jgi:hypothetical protein
MKNSLPTLHDGDRLIGQACIQPVGLRYCPLCDCMRTFNKDWTVIKIDGDKSLVCNRHQRVEH